MNDRRWIVHGQWSVVHGLNDLQIRQTCGETFNTHRLEDHIDDLIPSLHP